jgi:hypothetical protein
MLSWRFFPGILFDLPLTFIYRMRFLEKFEMAKAQISPCMVFATDPHSPGDHKEKDLGKKSTAERMNWNDGI